jgi:hypothetical protein
VPVAASDGRRRLLVSVGAATDQLALALAALTEAYEQMDDAGAERLERDLFKPVQGAYGRARRTHSEFARRSGLPGRTFATPAAALPGAGVRGLIERAMEAVESADATLIELQDSLAPVEFGDRELRDGLSEVRQALDASRQRSREVLRTFGR